MLHASSSWQKRTTWKGPIIYLCASRKDTNICCICLCLLLLGNPDTCTEYNNPLTPVCGQQLQLKKRSSVIWELFTR